jgi:hemoglobin
VNESDIGRLVDNFYAKVQRDDMLGPIFADAIGDGWDLHLATMRTFWCSVMLGAASYKGNPMTAHLRLPRLTSLHFERWLHLWRETAAEVCGDQGGLFFVRAQAIAGRLLSVVTSGASPAEMVQIS